MKRLWMIPAIFVSALALAFGLVRDSGAASFSPVGGVSTTGVIGPSALSLKPSTPQSDVAPSNVTISSMAPYASASVNTSPGNLVLAVPSPVGAGVQGYVQMQTTTGNTLAQFGTDIGSSQGIMWLSGNPANSFTPTASNFAIFSNGTSTQFNGASNSQLTIGSTTYLEVTTTAETHQDPVGAIAGVAYRWTATSQSLTATSGTNLTLANTVYNNPHIKFTGTLGGAGTKVTFPSTDGACWDLDFSAVVNIGDSVSLIANSVTWATPVAAVASAFPHVCYSSGAGRLVGNLMTE